MDAQKANEAGVAAPGTVTIGDNTYLVEPFSKRDFMALMKSLRQLWHSKQVTPLQACMKDLEIVPEKYRAEAIKAAVGAQSRSKGKTAEPEVPELTGLMYEIDGARRLAWLAIRKLQPSYTLQQATSEITEDNVDAVLAEMFVAAGLEDLEKNGSGANG